MSSEIAPHLWLPEPALSFHPDRRSDQEIHPLRGLCRFGPYSSGWVPDPIRVATLAPAGESHRLYEFMRELNSTYRPTERRDYLPDWPGFRGAFSLQMRAAGGSCHIELDAQLETDFRASPAPHIALADRLVRAIHGLEARRAEFDVLFIYLPQRSAGQHTGSPRNPRSDRVGREQTALMMSGCPSITSSKMAALERHLRHLAAG